MFRQIQMLYEMDVPILGSSDTYMWQKVLLQQYLRFALYYIMQ